MDFVVPGGQERVLEFLLPKDFDDRPGDEIAILDIEWEYIQPIWRKTPRRLRVKVPIRNIRALRKAHGPETVGD